MRFYLVDKNGNVLGDFSEEITANLALGAYAEEEIKENEIEIIMGGE